MSTPSFTPALGRVAPARLFDYVVALARERLWRALAAMYVAPQPGDVVADIGCGTGSLALL
jgi:precorrin-6B methylase 2